MFHQSRISQHSETFPPLCPLTIPYLDECLQQVVDGDPAEGAFLVPCEDLSSTEVHRVLLNGLGDLSEDLISFCAILLPAEGDKLHMEKEAIAGEFSGQS